LIILMRGRLRSSKAEKLVKMNVDPLRINHISWITIVVEKIRYKTLKKYSFLLGCQIGTSLSSW
jgi:hypothetical protein